MKGKVAAQWETATLPPTTSVAVTGSYWSSRQTVSIGEEISIFDPNGGSFLGVYWRVAAYGEVVETHEKYAIVELARPVSGNLTGMEVRWEEP